MKRSFLLFLFTITVYVLYAQDRTTLGGYVRDASDGEALIGANIIISETGRGTVTNEYGYYVLSLEKGEYTVTCSYMGYSNFTRTVLLDGERILDIELEESLHKIQEVTVSAAGKNVNVSSMETGSQSLQIQTIRKIPAFLGEVDIIKAIQLLPGVQFTSEGSSGFSVRGGGRDQNLILLDESSIYNPSHLMGFFSVFNNDAIKDVKLYKGDIPARSGGRLASLLDVRMKEGNSKEFHGRGGIGTVSSRFTLEGPIIPDKLSFLVAGRRTYADLFLLFSKDETLRQTRLYFFDLNGKLNYRINDNNNIYLSAYYGKDIYSNKEFAGMVFGNRTLTMRWNHLFGKKLFSNFTLMNTNYFYDMGTPEGSAQYFNWISFIDDYGFKEDFSWYPSPDHTFHFGFSSTYHRIRPGSITATSQSGINQNAELADQHSIESGAYFSGEAELGDRLSLRYGLRYSHFMNLGPSTVYSYDDDYFVSDSSMYEKGEIYNTYHGPEPRLAANYMFSDLHSIKASYARTMQYLQLASNSTAGMPLEIWFPASPNIEPQLSDQFSVGYFRNFLNHKLETSLELYYKEMNNTIDFRDHAQLMLNPRLDGEIRVGEATSYGAEFFIKYEDDRFTGWVSYTLSKTMRDIPEINEGRPYPAPYDKPNDLAIVASYDLNDQIGIGLNWVYSTGIPFTLPSGRYEINGVIVPLYTDRNAYRLPDYHRLDFSITLRRKERPNQRWRGEWNVSVYNAYARKNIWTLNFVTDDNDPNIKYAEMTYLFSVVPSISYNFKF